MKKNVMVVKADSNIDKKPSKFGKLVNGIRAQANDTGLRDGSVLVNDLKGKDKAAMKALAAKVCEDLASTRTAFSAQGPAGYDINRRAPFVVKTLTAKIPELFYKPENDGDFEAVASALVSDDFGIALRNFDELILKSNLVERQKILQKFSSIDWSAFNGDDLAWFAKPISWVKGGSERVKADELQLQKFIPLTKIPLVLANLIQAAAYANVMDGALGVYLQQQALVGDVSEENKRSMKRANEWLEIVRKTEPLRLSSIPEVKAAAEDLKKKMEVSYLIAEMVDRTVGIEAQTKAGQRVVDALDNHARYTFTAQEAVANHYLELDKVLTSNVIVDGHLIKSMSALKLYTFAHESFSFIVINIRLTLLTGSAMMMMLMGDEQRKSNGYSVAANGYEARVEGFRSLYTDFLAKVSANAGEDPDVIDAEAVNVEASPVPVG